MIDDDAPVKAAADIEIEASPLLVWDVMTAVSRWPNWNPDVKSASIDGPVTPGKAFRWRVTAGSIKSTLKDVEQPRLLSWTGRMAPLGIEAAHVWRLEARDGRTLVRTEESWNGRLVRFLSAPSRGILLSSIEKSLEHLKRECERRAAEAPPERSPQSDD